MRSLLDNLKNISGWRTADKLVVLAVDDYCNVRIDSKSARDSMIKEGLDLSNRFDRFDALETREDLEALFEILSSVVDGADKNAIVSSYSLCANISFETTFINDGYYHYEKVTDTFGRLAAQQPQAYEGTWDLLGEGIKRGLIKPQFHGREHLNVELIERKLRAGDRDLGINLAHNSVAGIGAEATMPGVGYTHAFGLSEYSEIDGHINIIADGVKLFEEAFGFPAHTFAPPAQKLHPKLYSYVESLGILSIDKPRSCVRTLDKNKSLRELNSLGKQHNQQHVSVVRNVVFEPTADSTIDSVALALSQIRAAFRWKKPAIVSSHRVNFGGHIDPGNRKRGLADLRRLLEGITSQWPDARFVTVDELVGQIWSGP